MLLLFMIGLTYAFFSAKIDGEETTIIAASGKMVIQYDGGPDIL